MGLLGSLVVIILTSIVGIVWYFVHLIAQVRNNSNINRVLQFNIKMNKTL